MYFPEKGNRFSEKGADHEKSIDNDYESMY